VRTVRWVQKVPPLIGRCDDVDRAIDLMREANHMAIALLNEL
jgi:hypothetical protein